MTHLLVASVAGPVVPCVPGHVVVCLGVSHDPGWSYYLEGVDCPACRAWALGLEAPSGAA